MLSLMNSALWMSTDLCIFVSLLKATNKAGKCQVILFLSVKIQFIESECEVTQCQPLLQWSSPTQTSISESGSVMTDQNALRINTSTCQRVFLCMKKAVKICNENKYCRFSTCTGFSFSVFFLFPIINVSEDQDSDTRWDFSRKMKLPASFTRPHVFFYTKVHVHAALFHTMKVSGDLYGL